MPDKVMNVRVPEEIHTQLKAIAKEQDRTMHSLMRLAFKRLIEQERAAKESQHGKA